MLYRFRSHPSPGYYEDGRLVTVNNNNIATARTKKRVTASGAGGNPSGFGAGSSYSSDGASMSSFTGGMSASNVDRYNPVRDRLDEGSVVEDWIPRDASGLDEMFKLMYHRDHIAGTIVDLIADTIWSEYDLLGIQDSTVKKIYMDNMEGIDAISSCTDLTREFMVIGRSASSMIFDKTSGLFTDVISHDPSFLRIAPIPIKGFDPKIDLIPSPAMRAFIESEDPRDMDARGLLPQAYINAIRAAGGGVGPSKMVPSYLGAGMGGLGAGGIPLDPINTLFIPRKVFSYDYVGTSFFTRLITFWALEKALINATVTSARRRIRSILHITAGIEDKWEASPQELDNIAGMFIQADEDPVGAVVATRNGVDINEVRAGGDFYKWSDEWALLTEGKLRALGANSALLEGDATYSNQESAKMFFMERALSLRETLTRRIFYNRFFPLIARIHGFRKIPQSELDHKIRIKKSDDDTSTKFTQREALSIPDSQLLCPTIQWRKELVNSVDGARLDTYEKLESKGIPVGLRNWAAAGGVDLDALMGGLDEDANLRASVARWKNKWENQPNVEDEARLAFLKSLRSLSHANLRTVVGETIKDLGPLSNYVFWDQEAKFGTVHASEMAAVLKCINPDNSALVLRDGPALYNKILSIVNGNKIKAEVSHFLLFRSGLTKTKPGLSLEAQEAISNSINAALNKYSKHKKVHQLGQAAKFELKLISSCVEKKKSKKASKLSVDIKNRNLVDPINPKDRNLYSGKS